MVRRYVREAGVTAGIPDNDLAAVIVTSTARYVSNPSGTLAETVGPFSSGKASSMDGLCPTFKVTREHSP